MFPDRLIEGDSLRSDADGFSIEARIPWYRALPLSSVTGIALTVDGHAVPTNEISFAINGQRYGLDELPPLHDEWWYVTDGARVSVSREGGLPEGEHTVDLELGIFIPYLVFDGDALVIRERCVKTMRANPGGAE